MASFSYTVDTSPMANEIRGVSKSVNKTTTAVVAMQTAVIIAENKAANHVCTNVNNGFYALIRSQISQKIAKLKSDVDSLFMELVQQKKALLDIKKRMEHDYHMITSRYVKLFGALDTNLKNRVFELDKPTFNFAYKDINRSSNRTRYLTATIPIAQLESISISQRIVASNVKQKGLGAIASLKRFLAEMNDQRKLTDRILIDDKRFSGSSSMQFVPVVICECVRDRITDQQVEITVPEIELDHTAGSAIKNTIYSELPGLAWVQRSAIDPEVTSEFSKFLSNSAKSQRIKDVAMYLFHANVYQTI